MFFDDRLATVLRHRATSERGARTQYRQLLDLLGGRSYGRDDSLLAAAWLRLGALGEQIPANERARIIREPGWRFRNIQLAVHLVEDEPEVTSAALTRVDLEEGEWLDLIPHMPIRARGFLRHRRDLPTAVVTLLDQLGIHDRGLPNPVDSAASEPEAAAATAEADDASEATEQRVENTEQEASPPEIEQPSQPETEPVPEPVQVKLDDPSPNEGGHPVTQAGVDEKSVIAATIERIAQFRRERSPETSSDLSPRLPLDEQVERPRHDVDGFAFESDAQGRIIWAEANVAPMVIGQRIASRNREENGGGHDPIATAFALQQPIESALRTLEGADAIRGEWVVDAHPRFSRSGGRFHGYVGRFRRPFDLTKADCARIEAERLRQLLHELRTPVNAVQGFAELIHQQLYCPVPNAYRALAATIASDAASILAGFDELERLAKLESGIIALRGGKTDLVALGQKTAEQLSHVLAPRMAGITLSTETQRSMWAEIDPEDAEALVWRILATLAGATTAGENLAAAFESDDDKATLWCQIPAQLIAEDDVFAAEVSPNASDINAGLFGAGFSLRLARAEASGAGGDLVQDEDRIVLTLPITAIAAGHGEYDHSVTSA